MKKTLSILVALLMIFSAAALAGCNGEETPASEAPVSQTPVSAAPKDTEEAPKDMQARLDAGEDIIVGLSFNGLGDSFMVIQHDLLMENFTSRGFNCVSAVADDSVPRMIEQLENFITMNAALVIAVPIDTDSLKETSLKAIESGTYIVYMGISPPDDYEVSGGSSVNWNDVGRALFEMACHWVDLTYPDAANDPVKVAFANFTMVEFYKVMCDNIIQNLNDDPRFNLVYTKDMVLGTDGGFTFAEEALTTDRDTKLFLIWQYPASIGVNNYIVSNPGFDLSTMAVFSTGSAPEAEEVIELSKTDEGVYRGSVSYGFTKDSETPVDGMLHVCYSLLFGEAEPPYWNYDQIWTIDTIGFDLII